MGWRLLSGRVFLLVVLMVWACAVSVPSRADGTVSHQYVLTFSPSGRHTLVSDGDSVWDVGAALMARLNSFYSYNAPFSLGAIINQGPDSSVIVGTEFDAVDKNGGTTSFVVSAIDPPPADGDLRGYTVQEILVVCAGFLAFGIGWLVAK